MTGDAAIRRRLRAWVAATARVDPASVADDTSLFSSGLLKSLDVPELILLIEEISGSSIDVEKLRKGVFADVDTIARTFFPAPEAS